MACIDVDTLAGKIWEYHLLHQTLLPSDAVLVLGSNDLRVAEFGASLCLAGWAPILIVSGGVGRFTEDLYGMPEAD